MSEPLLRITGLRKTFHTQRGSVQAVDGVDLELHAGTTLALVGESGSGKTTLGRCVLGLIDYDAGTVEVEGREVSSLGRREQRAFRRGTQMVFQAQSASLNPRMTVGKTLEEPLRLSGERDGRARRARVAEALTQVQLDPAYVSRFPSELSGGEQQRVGIARAIITRPRLVVLDEPTAALDASVRKGIYELLDALQGELRLAYLLISHDLASVWGVSDRVAVMHRGRIVELGARADVFLAPSHPYTVALMSAAPYVGERPVERRARLVLGAEDDLSAEDVCRFAGRCPMAVGRCREARPAVEPVEAEHLVACWRAAEVPNELEQYRSAWRALELQRES